MRDDLDFIRELIDPTTTVAEARHVLGLDEPVGARPGHTSQSLPASPVPGLTHSPAPGHTPAA